MIKKATPSVAKAKAATKRKPIARPITQPIAKATVKPTAKPAVKPSVKPVVAPPAPAPAAVPQADADSLAALRRDMAELRATVEKSLSPVASGSLDEVDALRRVLSYLFEAKVETIIRDLVSIRHVAVAAAGGGRAVLEPIDALLADLGAVKFEAERLEHVDPLIHAITRETHDEKIDDAVIVENVRPGFRTARGAVIAKALVTVNRRG